MLVSSQPTLVSLRRYRKETHRLTFFSFRLAWEFVTINAGYGSSGFSIDGSELVWAGDGEFAGWLGMLQFFFSRFLSLIFYSPRSLSYPLIFFVTVCDWYHNAPQLFWIVSYYTPNGYPSTCDKVTLEVVDASS
jgi:hypothetical protein